MVNVETFSDSVNEVLLKQCPGLTAETFNIVLQNTLDLHAPSQTRVVIKRQSDPWMSASILKSKQQRRTAERKWRKTRSTADRQLYKEQIVKVKETIFRERRTFFKNKISQCKNSKSLFQIVNTMKGSTKSSPLPLDIPTENLPTAFSDYFTNKVRIIRSDLDKTINNGQETDTTDSFKPPNFSTFTEVSTDEVKEIILSSPPKSCPLDPIPTTLLLKCLDTVLDPITEIINHSLQFGVVPDCYKKAIVTPLLKKQNLDRENLKNYRPVSNLPFLSKILEKVVLKQLKNHLAINNLIEPFQSAYREHHSTETALLRIVNDILISCDGGEVSILTLLDLSAAFDTIDHSILCDRLSSNVGISGNVLSWFRSYLTDRSQSVCINGKSSDDVLL